jgi:RND family efflux transporter MFP subunit
MFLFLKSQKEIASMQRLSYLVSIIAAFILLPSCSSKSESNVSDAKENKTVPVAIMEISGGDFPIVVESVGRLVPNREVTLSAEIGGIIESYKADVGDSVIAEQALLNIDQTDYLLALKEAEASLAVARAGLEALENAFERSKSLLPQKVITEEAFEKIEAECRSARASVARSEVLVEISTERLNKTKIKAPFDGLISARMIETGQTVGAGEDLMTLSDLNPMRVKVYLTEADYADLDPDDPVSISIDAYPGSVLIGNIDRIGIKADARTNTFDIEILVDNPDLILKAGMTARARITTSVIHDAILIPQSTVLYRQEVMEVFVADRSQRAEARQVLLGRSKGSMVRVLSGLNPGDRLVITGGQYLENGDMLEISSSRRADAS